MKDKKTTRKRAGSGSETGHLIGMTGMNAQEVVDYLGVCGQEITIHTVKAWTKGAFEPRPAAIIALWAIWRAFEDPDHTIDLPEFAPQSVHDRLAAIRSIRNYFNTITKKRPINPDQSQPSKEKSW